MNYKKKGNFKMEYTEFLEKKIKVFKPAGFEVNEAELNINLFGFQKHIVKEAIKKGRYAIFADCGLGKTIMQLEWARLVNEQTKAPVLILAPLAVSGQTINEGFKFGIKVEKLKDIYGNGIYITNYEQLKNIEDVSMFSGVILDESSILKNFTGKYKNLLINKFYRTQYKLCCTATPSPNDLNEIGNHSEFLNILDAQDMRAKWFVRDEGMNNYRLKRHASNDFFGWVSSWAVMLSRPSDIGFKDDGYKLPALNYYESQITTKDRDNGALFNDSAVNATSFNKELRITIIPRLEKVKEIIDKSDENFIVWVNQNAEADKIKELIPESTEVRGNEDSEIKEYKLLGFAKNEFRILVTKKKIAQFGLNYQNCNNQIFASLDFSFEGLYQAIRRSHRFGQKKPVNIYIITTDTMQNVLKSIKRKEKQFNEMRELMNTSMNKEYKLVSDYDKREYKSDNAHLINGDCVEEIKNIPDNSIDFSVFSPPFSNLFTYSNNLRDMGNCEDDEEFFEQYSYLLTELYRVLKNGRLIAVHTKDLAAYKNSSGFSGLKDFTGENHRAIEKAGFKYHSKITIWTDPVLEMQRTKTQRLLYKQVTKDSTYSGVGLPEYVTIFRKWEGDESEWTPVSNKTKDRFGLDTWQKWASPVWFDIKRTDVLNNFRGVKEASDEKHIAPLQLEVIKRLVAMYTNEGETVFTPFAGIGSELYESIKLNRKAIGIELKPSYYEGAIKNIRSAELLELQEEIFN